MAIASGIVWFGCHHEANGIAAEIMEFTPCARRNDNAISSTLYDEGLRTLPIIDVNNETSDYSKQRFMALPVGMSASPLSGRNVRNPENT